MSDFRQPKPRCADLKIGDFIQMPPGWPQEIRERKPDNSGWWLADTCGIADSAFDNNEKWQVLAPSIVFIKGRVKFGVLRENRRQEAASHPSALFGWNVDLARCASIGHVLPVSPKEVT